MKARRLAGFVLVSSLVFVLTGVTSTAGAGSSGWSSASASGFGTANNYDVFALAPFGGQLYAGTVNDGGAQLWRRGSSGDWASVTTNGFNNSNNIGVDHLIEFKSQLYAGTYNQVDGGQVWRSSTGNSGTWSQVVPSGFSGPANGEVFRFAVYSDTLYAGTWSYITTTHGAEMWRTTTGNASAWTQVVTNGFSDNNNEVILSSETFGDYLYVGTGNNATGGEVWRCQVCDGGDWTQVNTDGFGSTNYRQVSALAAFDGYLYAATMGKSGLTGASIWRCQTCAGGDWTKVVDNGFGNINTRGMSGLQVYDDDLYFAVGNSSTGMEVWRSSTGGSGSWEQVGFAGFGQSDNWAPYWDNALTVFNDKLYVGTWNQSVGGQVWLYPGWQVNLPAIMRCYPWMSGMSPISNPDGDGKYTVEWSWASCAPTPNYFELQYDDNPGFSSPASYVVSETTYDADTKTPGTYYWRVRANLPGTGPDSWSNVQSTTVTRWFSYVWVYNNTGQNMTVEIVGVESKVFPGGSSYWRSIVPGQYTYKAWAWCGSGQWTDYFDQGDFALSFRCTYGVPPASVGGNGDRSMRWYLEPR
jgi:hypothetical protein